MTTTTLERTEGLSVLNQAMAAIKEKIEEKRGVFNIQMEVSERPSLLDQTAACNQRFTLGLNVNTKLRYLHFMVFPIYVILYVVDLKRTNS